MGAFGCNFSDFRAIWLGTTKPRLPIPALARHAVCKFTHGGTGALLYGILVRMPVHKHVTFVVFNLLIRCKYHDFHASSAEPRARRRSRARGRIRARTDLVHHTLLLKSLRSAESLPRSCACAHPGGRRPLFFHAPRSYPAKGPCTTAILPHNGIQWSLQCVDLN